MCWIIVEQKIPISVDVLFIHPDTYGIVRVRTRRGEDKCIFFPFGTPDGFKLQRFVSIVFHFRGIELNLGDEFSFWGLLPQPEMDIFVVFPPICRHIDVDSSQMISLCNECLTDFVLSINFWGGDRVGEDVDVQCIMPFQRYEEDLQDDKEPDKKEFFLFVFRHKKLHDSFFFTMATNVSPLSQILAVLKILLLNFENFHSGREMFVSPSTDMISKNSY